MEPEHGAPRKENCPGNHKGTAGLGVFPSNSYESYAYSPQTCEQNRPTNKLALLVARPYERLPKPPPPPPPRRKNTKVVKTGNETSLGSKSLGIQVSMRPLHLEGACLLGQRNLPKSLGILPPRGIDHHRSRWPCICSILSCPKDRNIKDLDYKLTKCDSMLKKTWSGSWQRVTNLNAKRPSRTPSTHVLSWSAGFQLLPQRQHPGADATPGLSMKQNIESLATWRCAHVPLVGG